MPPDLQGQIDAVHSVLAEIGADGLPELLVVNKALPSFDFQELSNRIVSTYKTPVGAVLPLTVDIVRLGSGGLFTMLYPDHAFSVALRGLAEKI